MLTRGLACLCVALASLAVVESYPSVSQTIDEATHVATGLEWLGAGSYRLQPETPPLVRALLAVGPFLDGAHPVASLAERNAVLASDRSGLPRLWYARLANLLALIGVAGLVFGFALRLHDETTALVAVLLSMTLPPLLAHAGVATTDMGFTATLTAAFYAFVRWLENPSLSWGVALGVATALALLSKFSALPFLAAAFGLVSITRRGLESAARPAPSLADPPARRSLGVAAVLGLFLVWGGYRFSVGSPFAGVPSLPAPELLRGLLDLQAHYATGHLAYLLGEVRTTGWWYFFPVAVLVKTPIPFLVLVVSGILSQLSRAIATRRWQLLAPLLGVVGILLSVLPSRLNIGLRHVLPIYPLLSVVAAAGAVALMRAPRHRGVTRSCLAVLLVWQIASVVATHPAHLSYFNPLAGDKPEAILVDSDLDWGQDVDLLLRELARREIEDVSLLLFSTMAVPRARLPRGARVLEEGDRARGWVAASLFHIKVSRSAAWLEDHEPVARIGRSILLYDVSALSETGGRGS